MKVNLLEMIHVSFHFLIALLTPRKEEALHFAID